MMLRHLDNAAAGREGGKKVAASHRRNRCRAHFFRVSSFRGGVIPPSRPPTDHSASPLPFLRTPCESGAEDGAVAVNEL